MATDRRTKYQFTPGKKLSGEIANYEIVEPMRPGGRGETYKAKVLKLNAKTNDLKINQEVVIKIPKLTIDASITVKKKRLLKIYETFMDEAIFLGYLKTLDCVAHVLDHGAYKYQLDSRRGISTITAFIVQEYIQGKDLCDYLNSKYEGKFTGIRKADEFFEWAWELANCLLQIHQRQVVHGDIWPPNIMINSAHKPIFIDFGEAIFREMSIDSGAGEKEYSHRFVAPEGFGTVGADIYSLGGILFYLATGKEPSVDIKKIEDIDLLKNTITREVKTSNVNLYEENSGVIDIITRTLRSNQHERIPHAEVLLQDIETFSKIGKIKSIPNIQRKIKNPLFSWMASLRMRLLNRNIEDMANGIYDLIGDHETIVSGLTQYLSPLQKGDLYLTVSLPSFWSSGNIGINGRFLTMNKLAAERGATIRRIFLITPDDKQHSETEKILNSHKHIMEELSAKIITDKYDVDQGGYFTGILEIDKSEREIMYRERKHFGLLVEKGKEIWIFPIYRKDETVVAIQFRTDFDFGQGLRQDFNSLLSKSIPIQKYSF